MYERLDHHRTAVAVIAGAIIIYVLLPDERAPVAGAASVEVTSVAQPVKTLAQSVKVQPKVKKKQSAKTPILKVEKRRERVVNEAIALLGTPYVWGGESFSEGGFDCSGLFIWAYRKIGFTDDRWTTFTRIHEGAKINAQKTTHGLTGVGLLKGDLIFYLYGDGSVGHVSMYIGVRKIEGKMQHAIIHSPRTGDVVKITPLNGIALRVAGIRRYI